MPQLRLLGRAAIMDDAGQVAALSSRRHPVALLALLTVTPSHALARGRLTGFLWPDAPEKRARNRLTTCIHQVRSALGEDVLRSVGGDVQLDVSRLPSDVGRFREALATGDAAAVVAIYAGPFLDGFWLDGARDFEERVERERDRLEQSYLESLEALARDAAARGDDTEAARWWKERADQTPLDSRVAGELMEALARTGGRGQVMQVARDHARALARELGAEADPAFLARAEELTRGTMPPSGGSEVAVPPPRRSVAVLPFDTADDSGDARILADGLLEDLLTELARVPDLVVIAGGSARKYRDTSLPPLRIASDLGVAHLVRGSVQVLDGRLRLQVRLVDPGRDAYVWAERYDRALTPGGLFEIRSDLAEKIARTLRVEIGAGARERSTPITQDMEAYRLYALGRAFMSDRSRVAMWRAVESFEKALDRDPRHALAWTGLSDALVLLGDYHYEKPAVVRDRGEQAARRALELDPELAEAHASLGNFLSWQRRISEAIASHRRATELRPGYAHAHQWLCWVQLLAGEPEEARAAGARATRLDPFEPEAGVNLAVAHLGAGDPQAGLTEVRRVLGLYPGFQYGRFAECLALWAAGDWEGGAEAVGSLTDAWTVGLPELARVLALAIAGQAADARAVLAGMGHNASSLHRALALSALGERDGALIALGEVRDPEWPDTLLLRYHPPALTHLLSATPAYRAFVARVNASWGVLGS